MGNQSTIAVWLAWLATTAKQQGHRIAISATSSKSAKKRAKTKARKQPPSQASQGSPTYTVAINDFTTLAEFLAAKDGPRVQVPLMFGVLLDRAIATRQWYTGAISSHLPSDEGKKESDDRHTFFLGVLYKVRDILSPLYPQDYVPRKKAPKSMSEFVNMFANLELEEPSAAFEQAPDVVVTPWVPTDADANYKLERLENL
jgi:hypothetical protein